MTRYPRPVTTSPQAPPPGLTVDGYTLLTRIGEGGMGVVHLARRGDGPRVALKVLRPHIVGDDEIRARLAREVNSLSRIRSPRVAEIVDADPWGDIPYVATRYVPGLSLHEHAAEEGPVAEEELTHLAALLAEGLAAVHECGVLHRDVKPSNVLMEGRNPVLIDFGLARVADDPKLTHTGWLLGTPGYLAPEILYGDDATTASDVHSWAATVAYAGLGRPPFGRGPGMAIMDRVRRGEHDLTGLPEPLLGLLAAALDPEPERRPTVDELREELAAMEPDFPFFREADGEAEPVRPADPQPFTMPFHAAPRHRPEEPTRVDEPEPFRTRPVTGVVPPPVQGGWVGPTAPPRVTTWERLRRSWLFGGLTLAAGAAVAAYPVLAGVTLLIAAWLLRSGSLAGSAAGNRRLLRGRKWYDHLQTLFATPWHLMQSVPGTIGLGLWSLGVGFAGGLLSYATAATTPTVMGVVGVLFAGSLGLGPGGHRVRGPLRRVVHPLARRPLVWVFSLVAVLVAAGFVGSFAQAGPDWAPFAHGPFGWLSS